MRSAFVAVIILIGGAAAAMAQPGRPYEVYVFDPEEGSEVYAFAGPSRTAALEVRGCGDFSMLNETDAIVAEMRARRRRDDVSIVHIEGRRSRVELGWCGNVDHEDTDEDDVDDESSDTLIVIDGLNASQMRRIVRSIDAAPEAAREDLLVRLGLRR